jgi:hypothetical protein
MHRQSPRRGPMPVLPARPVAPQQASRHRNSRQDKFNDRSYEAHRNGSEIPQPAPASQGNLTCPGDCQATSGFRLPTRCEFGSSAPFLLGKNTSAGGAGPPDRPDKATS